MAAKRLSIISEGISWFIVGIGSYFAIAKGFSLESMLIFSIGVLGIFIHLGSWNGRKEI
ncbi:hypothetical protein MALU111345_01480 [Marinicrinis lubricantis]